MRNFVCYRPEPPAEYVDKGLTNAGRDVDFEGTIFSDGTVVVRWLTDYRSHSIWPDWETLYRVHGHPEYGTVIEFGDGGEPPCPT